MKTQANIRQRPEFRSSLNKQPCLSAASAAQSRSEVGAPALPSPQLFLISGAQRGEESEREKARAASSRRKGKEEGAGLREFAGSLVYSVVVLTSERTPADTGAAGVAPM